MAGGHAGQKPQFQISPEDVIAKGKNRASFLSGLSNTKWGIPPKLFKILIRATVHARTDYAVGTWMTLPVPKFFTEKPTTLDTICATKALGALRNSLYMYLRHNLNMNLTEARLTEKILNTVDPIVAKPSSHPLYVFYKHAQETNPCPHKGPLYAFFQSPLADHFRRFLDLQQPDPTMPLQPTPNFKALILPNKVKEAQSIQVLKASKVHLILYLDGSQV